MLLLSFLLLAGLGAVARAQNATSFEPADFNVTAALLGKGINVTAIPALQSFEKRSSTAACAAACSSLGFLYGSRVIKQSATTSYDNFTASYWSAQQEAVDPYCIFKPTSAVEVSIQVLLSRLTQCPFAVKSGGHAAFAGASSIDGGITVSLELMNDVTLSADKSTASIGGGSRWLEVYTTLEDENVAVVGGRVSSIGVGGLTTGGGLSFFSNIYGWACDNVASYEVVTASGLIVTASPTSFTDLYWALRGGGPNFGIVTTFHLRTIPQGLMWGGSRVHLEAQFPALIQAFVNLGHNVTTDPNAAQILSFTHAEGLNLASADLQYALPEANASVLAEYLAVPDAIEDTTAVRSLANLTLQFNSVNPNGLRETYWTATYVLDADLVTFVKDTFYAELAAIADAADLVPAATLQVISTPMLAAMAQHGGNPLGLNATRGPLLLLNMNMMWSDAADDDRILTANKNVIDATVAAAAARGLDVDYLYMNYASQYQAVVPSYGAANLERLKTVAATYDPAGVFQTLEPGYFKLAGAPATWDL